MKTVKERLKSLLSRKFLVTAVGNLVSLILLVGADTEVTKIIGCVSIIVIDAIYITMEALIDKSNAVQSSEITSDILESVTEDVKDVVTDTTGKFSLDDDSLHRLVSIISQYINMAKLTNTTNEKEETDKDK